MAPCFYSLVPYDIAIYEELEKFDENGVYALNGPDFDKDRKTVCEK